MPRTVKFLFAAIAGSGALLGAGCTSVPAHPSPPMHGMQDGRMGSGAGHGPGSHAGMLDQMRAHHRCVEGEMAKRPDGGRTMPDRAAMAEVMQRCPMPAAMHESMMMMQHGRAAEPATGQHPDHAVPSAPAHGTQPDEQ